ncbi:MAG: hypothetical protein K9M01_02935 [Candidatus Omnitrophica bacterium]|nr:hypothetical protein [Candidatus Omnitrophota bacterium]MCF7917160.1 hypothetical protein [Candidatus Omnitrophota bacterium]
MKHLFLPILTLFLLTNSLIAEDKLPLVSEDNLREEETFGDYTVKIYRDYPTGEGLLHIFKDDKLVYSKKDWKFTIGHVYDELDYKDSPKYYDARGGIANNSVVAMGKDITGDGEPNLLVSHWSGGAHCCFSFYVFSIGEDFRLIQRINNEDGDLGKFVDVDDDGALEFIGNDWTFSYWRAPFSQSPAPRIILKYRDGKYRLALDLMKSEPLDPERQAEMIQRIKADMADAVADKEWMKEQLELGELSYGWVREGVAIPPLVWKHMLQLIYYGDAKSAWDFLDKVWPEDKPGKEEFLADFKKVLAESPYWDSLEEIVGNIGGKK